MSKWLKAGLVLAAVLIVIQAIRPNRTNPRTDPRMHILAAMTVPQNVDAILNRSCGDCHTNETIWPWYSRVAPVSWLVSYDVVSGRKSLNFSEWTKRDPRKTGETLGEICKEVTEGEMPGFAYRMMHPEARLGGGDVSAICAWTRSAAAPQAAQADVQK
jgi:Haem-binding domain